MSESKLRNAGLHVVLVEPEIPPNTGTIARLCAATDTRLHLIEPLGFELSDRMLKRAGMDYWQHVNWRVWPSLAEAQQSMSATARWHYFTTKAKRVHWEVSYQPGDVLVFGRESKGLAEVLLAQQADHTARIPMAGEGARSLNLATAASIAVYEALRQCAQSKD